MRVTTFRTARLERAALVTRAVTSSVLTVFFFVDGPLWMAVVALIVAVGSAIEYGAGVRKRLRRRAVS